jgi:hypothetical protein
MIDKLRQARQGIVAAEKNGGVLRAPRKDGTATFEQGLKNCAARRTSTARG